MLLSKCKLWGIMFGWKVWWISRSFLLLENGWICRIKPRGLSRKFATSSLHVLSASRCFGLNKSWDAPRFRVAKHFPIAFWPRFWQWFHLASPVCQVWNSLKGQEQSLILTSPPLSIVSESEFLFHRSTLRGRCFLIQIPVIFQRDLLKWTSSRPGHDRSGGQFPN